MTRRVLVVDDEAGIRNLVADVLEEEGYAVDQAVNGREALLKLQRCRPDVVLLDLMMPVMDGWTFARACHELLFADPIPILVMSASHGLARSAEELHRFGVRGVLAKPFDLDIMVAAVGRLATQRAPVAWPA